MSELLNCPFCYSANVTIAGTQAHTYICCEDCKAGIPGSPYGGRYYDLPRDEAIERWNRRTPQPVTPAGGEVEPVAWEYRYLCGSHWTAWQPCTENLFDEMVEFAEYRGHKAEARALYINPPVADAALKKEGER